MNCNFCKITTENTEKIIWETKSTITVLSNPQLMSGHLLVIPKRHVEKLSDLSKEEREEIITETIFAQEKILETIAPGCDVSQHFRPFIPDNAFKVSHLHIHIRPRFLDDELYMKVQKYENEVFHAPSEEDFKKYKELFSK